MGVLVRDVVDLAAALVSRAAAEQGGVITGDNPATYSASDPLRLWVIQVVVVIGVVQLLALLFARIKQPRVIAEVVGGIILGPTVMGRIPNFTTTIFPTPSLVPFSLVANIGLVFFMFIVGMEVDFGVVKRNVKASVSISVAGLVIPLGMGAALGAPLYHEFVKPTVNYGYFLLFVAVAVGITAFPVLCRILTETGLLDSKVGAVTLAAGVGNDVVGWILLALTVALVNASSGVDAVYVLLANIGYILVLFFLVKPAYMWLAKRTGSLERGQPSTLMMTITLLLVLISAFYTDITGVHAIFGGFLAGLIIPHTNGYAIAIVEKLEDFVGIVFLPLYFVLSGLKTNLGLLNTGTIWGYVILICAFAFFSKFIACAAAARLTGFTTRESAAVGALMSCKGLVELIVLNVGLQAGIMDQRLFSMFVVHALVLTFITTPLTLFIYPVHHRRPESKDTVEEGPVQASTDHELKTRFTVVLDKMDQLSAAMTLTQLLQNPSGVAQSASTTSVSDDEKRALEEELPVLSSRPAPAVDSRTSIEALRLVELTARTSALLRSQEAGALLRTDPVLGIFTTFGRLNRLRVAPALSVVPEDAFASTIADHARDAGSQLVVLPWSVAPSDTAAAADANPFAPLIASDAAYTHHLRRTFAATPVDAAVFVDVATGAPAQHVFLPFFGGPDDRAALAFVVQLCVNPAVTATVVRVTKTDGGDISRADTIEQAKAQNTVFPDTVYARDDTVVRLQSNTADDLVWEKYTTSTGTHAPVIASALGRITFKMASSGTPLRTVVDTAKVEAATQPTLAVLGRSRRLAVESHAAELAQIASEVHLAHATDVQKTLGDVAAAVIASGVHVSVLVMQAGAGHTQFEV